MTSIHAFLRPDFRKCAEKLRDHVLTGIKVDYNGHFGSSKDGIPKSSSSPYLMYQISDQLWIPEAPDLVYAIESNTPLNDWASFRLVHTPCFECSEVVTFETNGLEWRCKDPCPFGPTYVIFDIDIPSGKMVVGNDFRRVFSVPEPERMYHETAKEMIRRVMLYADQGLAHCFVSNTSPHLYQCASDQFILGIARDEDERAKTWPGIKGSKRVAKICTDLWWYSICDHDDYVRKGGPTPDGYLTTIVPCDPGTYRFTHSLRTTMADDDEFPQVYSKIERIGGKNA